MIDTLVLEVTGIVVSGVVGPVVVTMAVTHGEHRHLEEQEAERDRDDLLRVLEEIAQLLGSAILDLERAGTEARTAAMLPLAELSSRLYPLQQRLLLRLRHDDVIAERLNRVMDVLRESEDAGADTAGDVALLKRFDAARQEFLDIARTELTTRSFHIKGRRARATSALPWR
jgi:hypothetical protein